MSNFQYHAGLHHVGVYQVSGAPYVTGSVVANVATQVVFPRVTKWVTVANHGTASVKVGFSENAMGNNPFDPADYKYPHNRYLRVPPHGSGSSCVQTFEVKCTAVWLSGSHSIDVMAGLTGLDIKTINNASVSPSGSSDVPPHYENWSGSAGAQV